MYLAELTLRLLGGIDRIESDFRAKTLKFLLATQQPDGGFSGRSGESDLYYTAFALRSLALLGELNESSPFRNIAGFLKRFMYEPLSAIDTISFLFSATLLEIGTGIDVFSGSGRSDWATAKIERFRRPDGGLAGSENSVYSSTYHTFLGTVTLQMLGLLDSSRKDETVTLVLSRQREDGGFVELEKLRHSGTNPSAAAIAILKLFDAFPKGSKKRMRDFILSNFVQTRGFRANSRIPYPDLLSTFSSMVALLDLEADSDIPHERLDTYLKSLRVPGGGYISGEWDKEPDVEYTFYGIASEALLYINS